MTTSLAWAARECYETWAALWKQRCLRPQELSLNRNEGQYSSRFVQTAQSTLLRASAPGGHLEDEAGRHEDYAELRAKAVSLKSFGINSWVLLVCRSTDF